MDPQWRWSEMQMQSLNPSLLPWLLKPTSPPLQPQRHKHLEIQLEGALVHLSVEVLKATTSSVSIFKHFHTSELPTYLVDYVVISNNHQVVVQHLWVCPTLKPDLFLFICQHCSSCLDQLFLSFFLFLKDLSDSTFYQSLSFVLIDCSLVFAITMPSSQLCCQWFITGSTASKSLYLDHYSPSTDKGSNL